MSNNKILAKEPSRDDVQEIIRLYRIIRGIQSEEKKPDEPTPEEKKLDELEEYNPHFSRHMWRGEVKKNTLKEEDFLLAEKFGLNLKY